MSAATKATATFGASLYCVDFLRLEHFELRTLLDTLRDPLTTQVYLLLLNHADFATGEFLGGYHRLMELCTPPKPERGARRPGPTYKQLRGVIDDLISMALVARDAMKNALQGQLRLTITARKKIGTPTRLEGTVQGRVREGRKPIPARAAAKPASDSWQDSGHGFHGVNTSFNSSNDGDLSITGGGIIRPPEGAQNGPHEPVTGQVEASPLMADTAGDLSSKAERIAALKTLSARLRSEKKELSGSRGGLAKTATQKQSRVQVTEQPANTPKGPGGGGWVNVFDSIAPEG